MTKLFRKKRFWFLTFFTLIMISFNSCLTFRKSNKKIYKQFSDSGLKPTISYFKSGEKTIRYIAAKEYNSALPSVVFLHGSPGSSQDFYDYLQDSTLNSKANLIVVDRLGYGYSDFGNAETSIRAQANSVNRLIETISSEKIILVGWSFGGPIAAKMAVQNTDIDALLLLAPAVDPKNEKHFALGYLAKWKLTRWFVPKAFQVAEQEKLAHAAELEQMKNDWPKLKIPVIHMHGDKDNLVPIENLAFSKKVISQNYLTPIVVENGGHLLPWKNYELVQQHILNLVSSFD